MIERGAICWANLGSAVGSAPAKRRPVLVIQADAFLRSRIATVIVASITSNTGLAAVPGNVFVPATASELRKDSVVNVSQIVTLDRSMLEEPVSQLPSYLLSDVDAGLRRVMGL